MKEGTGSEEWVLEVFSQWHCHICMRTCQEQLLCELTCASTSLCVTNGYDHLVFKVASYVVRLL